MSNKIALVTGSSRGLGKDMAQQLADNGLDVIVTYNSQKDEAEQVVANIKAKGQNAVTIQLDVTQSSNFDDFYKNVENALATSFGGRKLDYLVNNAGFGAFAPIPETSEQTLDDMFATHFKAPYLLAQKALPLMNDHGGIVNISSGLARFSFAGYSAYGPMKAAVESLTRYQAAEFGKRGIRSNVVAPGAIETDFGGGVLRKNPELKQQLSALSALGRIGQADDLGGVVAFLCSDASKWITGQRIEVSGGMQL